MITKLTVLEMQVREWEGHQKRLEEGKIATEEEKVKANASNIKLSIYKGRLPRTLAKSRDSELKGAANTSVTSHVRTYIFI
jgi:hypothetical protein